MQRNLKALSDNLYDIVIIGGGIYGACVAWDAVLRGLSVALVEKGDFGSATSSNSLKLIHGGFRYLKNVDIRRMRISIKERKNLMRIAPHLVHPLPVLIPIYEQALIGRGIFSAALLANDVVGFDRNQLDDPQKFIPPGRTISKDECLRLAPNIPGKGLTGGMIFYDAQVHNSERLIISFLRAAGNSGVQLANYLKAIGFLCKNSRVEGVEVEDQLTGDRFHIRARAVVNTSGPWVDQVLSLLEYRNHKPRQRFAKAVNIVTRPLFADRAVGISGSNTQEAVWANNRYDRFFFVVPWRGKSLIGTFYLEYDDSPDVFEIQPREIENFLDIFNQIQPSADLKPEEILFVHGGLVPISGVNPKNGQINLLRHPRIRDHRRDGVEGLLSVVAVKYTTARYVAEKVVERIFKAQGYDPPCSKSAQMPVFGGQIEEFETFLMQSGEKDNCGLDGLTVNHLIYNYGAEYPRILKYINENVQDDSKNSGKILALRAEVIHAVREEMAQKLGDVVLRRTELGTAGNPGEKTLRFCAQVMGEVLSWNQARIRQELEEVNDFYFDPR